MTKLTKRKFTYYPQRGLPRHCHQAQVFDETNGKSIALIEPTDDEQDATQLALLFSKAPELLRIAKDRYTHLAVQKDAGWLDPNGKKEMNEIKNLIDLFE